MEHGIADQILRTIVPGGLQEPGGEVGDWLSEVKGAGIWIASASRGCSAGGGEKMSVSRAEE